MYVGEGWGIDRLTIPAFECIKEGHQISKWAEKILHPFCFAPLNCWTVFSHWECHVKNIIIIQTE